ncbi:hypothetical protein EY04_06600 [Pseudomonas chlororaphis]|uniref:Phage protein n=1 Tax=Pseudomonas chlororaphis O6 TaxID=1037915 RepID=A0AB33WLL3_9PSED|nr:hypothetical protein [Pseudomonas chlororaphis]AIC18571.1 hypothetical protein EY04_06600 [Pseudomonas chlororaphis]EIM13867.1 hypothetical protein PchlO6_1504 [Pseudomonas chlororaphis O6]
MNTTQSINLPELKALATAAAKSPYDAVALNDYGMAVPPATVLDLIAEIERHRLVDAEGCKPEISTQPAGSSTADAAPGHDLDKAEGCKPDLITQRIIFSETSLAHALSAVRGLHDLSSELMASEVFRQMSELPSNAASQPAELVKISRIRESMENSAASREVAELQIGATHVRVTYHGIKWHHDRMRNGRWEPLAIEEFDEILCSTLKHEVNHD